MKILVVCQYYYPEQFKINDICEQLAQEGHLVTVLTGLPNYPTGKVPSSYRWGRKRKEIINGVEVQRCFEVGRTNGIVGMALNYGSYMLSASFKALFLKKDFDIILVYQLSPVTMALPGIVLKKLSKKPLYLYSCDIWPESMKNIISDESNIIYRLTKKLSTYIYSNCDHITVTSKPFINYFNQEHSIPMDKISYLPQHAEDSNSYVHSPTENDTTDFMFMGNIGISQDIDCILNAVETISHIPKFKVHFVGDGSCLEQSKQTVVEKKLHDIVEFHGRHPLEKMNEFYSLADVCLLTLKADNLVGLTMPSKLQGYMAAGKPVIGAIDGAAQEVIKESQCGKCVDAGDYKGLAEVMKDFVQHPDKYKNYGENGREYFEEHFTKDIFMSKLSNELNRLMEVGAIV
ncbi:MAG: glycosyltransferase family 4 protein [Paenibacillus sp.]|nr:glycosyltransferase family 4 protein [Paenibacillus sp.]